jgi:excisionase family DNA binding protein
MIDTLTEGSLSAQLRRVQDYIEELEGAGRNEDAHAVKLIRDLAEQAIAANPRPDRARELLTTGQAAMALGISDQTVRNWVAAGRLAAVKRGVRTMIPRQSVLEEIERSRVIPDAIPALTLTQQSAAVTERKEAVAALPVDVAARLEALHDKLENAEPLTAVEQSEMERLEREMANASASLLEKRIQQQRAGRA